MFHLKNLSIRRKQVLLLMLASTAAVALACAAFVGQDILSFRGELVERIGSMADVAGQNSTGAIDFIDEATATQYLGALKAEPCILAACLYDRQGRVFARYARTPSAGVFVPPPVPQLGHQFTTRGLELTRALEEKGDAEGTIYVLADLSELSHRLHRDAWMAFTVFGVVLLAAFALSSLLQRLVTRPILHLAGVAHQVAVEKNYSLRATAWGEDEIGNLIAGFNQMLDQIQQRDQALQAGRDQLERRVEERTRELAQSLSLLNATLESTADGIEALDTDGKIVCHNQRYAEMWGLPPELLAEGESRRCIAFCAQQMKDPEAYLRRIQDHSGGKEASDVLELKDGRVFERYIKPQVVGQKQVGLVLSFRDVTERLRAQRALAEESELMQALLDNTPDLIYFKNLESRFVRVSKSMIQRFGADDSDGLVGKIDFDLHPLERARTAFEDEQQIIRTGIPLIGKLESEALAGGEKLWVLTSKLPWRDKTGQVIGTFGISRDVTALKEAETKLGRERELLKELMDSSGDCIYFKDLQSRFVRCSNAMAKLFKVEDPALLIGRTDADFFAEEHSRAALEDEQTIIRTAQPIIGRTERENWLDGRITWCLTSKIPFRDEQGNIIGTFGISKDITALKEAEAKLGEAHQKLVETSRFAGMAEVATNVLHNVGNVLNSVNTSASLVTEQLRKSRGAGLTRLAELLEGERQDLAGYLARAGRADQLIGYLRTLAQHLTTEEASMLRELQELTKNIEHIKEIVAMQQSYATISGMVEVQPVAPLIEDAIRMHASALKRHSVRLVRQFDPIPDIPLDKHKILQILINLISNAKYALSTSTASDRILTIGVSYRDDLVRIVIQDNGVGIPPEHLTRIFSHGFTTRRHGHGFGLHSGALAAHEMGGVLRAESLGPGHGATFILELPTHPKPPIL